MPRGFVAPIKHGNNREGYTMPTIRKPKAGGRPTDGAEAKRHVVSCRVTPDVMAKLDAASAENGRSLAQEVEARLSGFFKLEELFGEPRRLIFMTYLADRIRQAEEKWGRDFQRDPATWAVAAAAVNDVMQSAYPGGASKSHTLRLMLAEAEKAEAEEASRGDGA